MASYCGARLLVGVLSTRPIASTAASAGEWPADKVVASGKGRQFRARAASRSNRS